MPQKGTAVEQAFARYLRYHEAKGSTDKTLAWHGDTYSSLVAFLTAAGIPADLDRLDADTARRWIAAMRERGLAQKTIATRVAALKAFTHWLTDEDYLPKDPLARRLPVPKVDDKAMPIFEPEEVDRLIGACDPRTVTGLRDRALILLLYSTMARSSELRLLPQEDIDWRRGQILIRRGKGGKPRIVPLRGAAERALHRYLHFPYRKAQRNAAVFLTDEGKPFTADGFRQIFFRLERKTGIGCNPHKFRHSGSVQYLRNGGKLETLQAILGHTSLDMTLHYARIAGVDVTRAHETADPARSLRTKA